MKKPAFYNLLLSVWEKITDPHASITDPGKRLMGKLVSFMVLVMIAGFALNMLFSSGLSRYSLLGILLAYWFSRTKYYSLALYILIGVLLASTLLSILEDGVFEHYITTGASC